MRQQTLRMVSHVSHAHASQLLGLVVEYVVDARTVGLAGICFSFCPNSKQIPYA
jgi:hypothetical protein